MGINDEDSKHCMHHEDIEDEVEAEVPTGYDEKLREWERVRESERERERERERKRSERQG